MKMIQRLLTLAFFASLILVGAQQASAQGPIITNSVVLNDLFPECQARGDQVAFTSIQAAVNATQNNGSISVCPGVYNETVRIIGKNLLLAGAEPTVDAGNGTLLPIGFRKAVIRPRGALVTSGATTATPINSSDGGTRDPARPGGVFNPNAPLLTATQTTTPQPANRLITAGAPLAANEIQQPADSGQAGFGAQGNASTFAIILVADGPAGSGGAAGTGTTVFNLTVDGSQVTGGTTAGGGAAATGNFNGILYRNAGGNVNRNSVRNTFNQIPAAGTGAGATGQLGGSTILASAAISYSSAVSVNSTGGAIANQTQNLVIQRNAVENFTLRGISVLGANQTTAATAVNAVVSGNSVTGNGVVANAAVAPAGGGGGAPIAPPAGTAFAINNGIFVTSANAQVSFNQVYNMATQSCINASPDPRATGTAANPDRDNQAVDPIIPDNNTSNTGQPNVTPTFGSSGELPTTSPFVGGGTQTAPGAGGTQQCLAFGIFVSSLRAETPFAGQGSSVNSNSVDNTDAGIVSQGNSAGLRIDANDVTLSNSNGITLLASTVPGSAQLIGNNGNIVTRNRVLNSRRAGIAVQGSNNQITNVNIINDADIAIVTAGSNNTGISGDSPTTQCVFPAVAVAPTGPNCVGGFPPNFPPNLGTNLASNVRLTVRQNLAFGGTPPIVPPRPEADDASLNQVLRGEGKGKLR